jgi:ABC-type transport system involved in multi-copper enzyme maturation permease subunit
LGEGLAWSVWLGEDAMLGHIIRKEVLDHILGFRFLILSVLGSLIIWASLYDGYAYYCERLEDYRQAKAEAKTRIQQIMVAEDWGEISTKGYLVHKPPAPMSIFVRGLEPDLGRSIRIFGHFRRLKLSPSATEPMIGIFPPLDLSLVVAVVLSLFVLLFTYDAVCGEKEGGTLRLIASFPTARDRLLLGKLIGVLVPTLAMIGLPLLLGIAAILLAPQIQFTGPELARLGLVLLTFVLYLTAFACAGLFASCLTHRAAVSFVILLTFWAVTAVVLPRLSLITADIFRPAPSVHKLETEKSAIQNELFAKRNDQLQRWMQQHSGTSGQAWYRTPEGREAFQIYFTQTREEMQSLIVAQHARLDEAFRNRYDARLDLAVTLARLSPAFALTNASVRLASS